MGWGWGGSGVQLMEGVPVKIGGCSHACSSAGILAGLGCTAGKTAWKSSPSLVSSISSSTLLMRPCSVTAQAGLYTSGAARALVLRLTTAVSSSPLSQ